MSSPGSVARSNRKNRFDTLSWHPAAYSISNDDPATEPSQQQGGGATTQIVVETLHKLLEDGHIDPAQFASLQVQLDWVQYKQNFREMVSVSRASGKRSVRRAWICASIRGRSRRITCARKCCGRLAAAIRNPECADDRIPLEDFKSFRHSIAWEFNKLYWAHLGDWEKATGKGYRAGAAGRQVRRQPRRRRSGQRGRFLDPAARHGNAATSFPPRFSFWKSAWAAARDAACSSRNFARSTSSAAPATIRGCAC